MYVVTLQFVFCIKNDLKFVINRYFVLCSVQKSRGYFVSNVQYKMTTIYATKWLSIISIAYYVAGDV